MIRQHLRKTTLKTPLRMLSQHAGLSTFVDESKVRINDQTRVYLTKMYPYYPREVVCCGGFLTVPELAWKINWHWELLRSMMNIALNMTVMNTPHRAQTEGLLRDLMMNPPRPMTGYIDRDKLGEPADESSMEQVLDRHRILCACKSSFRTILQHEPLRSRRLVFSPDSPLALRQYKDWWTHATNTVDSPLASKHGQEFAFDLGAVTPALNSLKLRIRIEDISLALGCRFRNDEGTHVHVEFPFGVQA
jgi:hypothetical protein